MVFGVVQGIVVTTQSIAFLASDQRKEKEHSFEFQVSLPNRIVGAIARIRISDYVVLRRRGLR